MKRNQPEPKPQLFIIADEIWQNSNADEINATVDDMREMGIFYPPCNHFEVLISARFIPDSMDKEVGEKLPEHIYNTYYKNNYYRVEVVFEDEDDWANKAKAELLYMTQSLGNGLVRVG